MITTATLRRGENTPTQFLTRPEGIPLGNTQTLEHRNTHYEIHAY